MLPLAPVEPGRKGAHADSAALSFGFERLNVPVAPEAPVARDAPVAPDGKLKPCSFKQLRYAVKAVLFNPPRPPEKLPFGRRLAHAVNAFANFELPPAKPEAPVAPRGNDPPAPPPGGPPLPPPGGPPAPGRKPPLGMLNETPCCFRHALYAVVEAFVEEEPEELVEVEFDDFELDVFGLPPPQAARVKASAPTVSSAGAADHLRRVASRRAIG